MNAAAALCLVLEETERGQRKSSEQLTLPGGTDFSVDRRATRLQDSSGMASGTRMQKRLLHYPNRPWEGAMSVASLHRCWQNAQSVCVDAMQATIVRTSSGEADGCLKK